MAKLWPEMDVYKAHLFFGGDLTEKEKRTFEQIEFTRNELIAGHAQYQVLLGLRSMYKIQDLRSREILWMTYNIFADLGLDQNEAGKRYVFENIYMETAQKAMAFVDQTSREGDYKSAAAFLKIHKDLIKEAATLSGAYNKALPGGLDPAQYERPVEVTFAVKQGSKKQLNITTGEVTEVVDVQSEEQEEEGYEEDN